MYRSKTLAATVAGLAGREAIRGIRTNVINPILRRGIQGTFNRRKQYTVRGGFPKSTMRGRRSYVRRRRGRSSRRASKNRQFRRRNVGRVGFNVGQGLTRMCKVDERAFGNVNARQLYVYNISDIPIGDNTQINTRDRSTVNMRGWNVKFCIDLLTTTTRMTVMNYAIVVPKAATSPTDGDFFRQFGEKTGTTRSQDFEVARTGFEMTYGKINTDLYYVIKHKRLSMVAFSGALQTEQYGGTHREMNFWVPFRRQLRYDEGELTVKCTTPVYFIFWLDKPTESGSVIAYNAANYGHMITAYFKNSQE